MTQTLRKRATDRHGVVHEVTATAWNLLEARCGIKSRWQDRVRGSFSDNVMTWDGFDPIPDVTCMACLVAEARA